MTLVEKVARELCRWDRARYVDDMAWAWEAAGTEKRAESSREARRIIKMVREEKHDSK